MKSGDRPWAFVEKDIDDAGDRRQHDQKRDQSEEKKIEKAGPQRVIKVTDDPAERSCRPSVDYLFRSLSHLCGASTIGLIMTGMG
ncbi:MAG: chemotaxis protein CheB, partial [Undibacterium sp.]